MRTSSVTVLALATLSLVACDRPHDARNARLPSVAPEAVKAAPNATEPPPLGVKTDVDAAETESIMSSIAAGAPAQPDKDGPDQALYVAAQDAAARAPDTASADEAKKRVLDSAKSAEGTEGTPNKPQSAELSKSDESTSMPLPGQANDHSSDASAKSGNAQSKP